MAMRAVGSHDPDPSVRNPDWLAERILGSKERAILGDHYAITAMDQDYRVAMRNPRVARTVTGMAVRTRFTDDHVLKAVAEGAVQVVNLGAGFDTRGYRFRNELSKTRIYEIDYGPTQEYKRRRLTEVAGPPASNLRYVPIDFTREQIADVFLERAGYRRDSKTVFIWEGVTMYLPRERRPGDLHVYCAQCAFGQQRRVRLFRGQPLRRTCTRVGRGTNDAANVPRLG